MNSDKYEGGSYTMINVHVIVIFAVMACRGETLAEDCSKAVNLTVMKYRSPSP